MKISHLYIGLIALFFTASLSSCLNDDNKIPPNCYDKILNNGEEAIDCGGPNCDACDPCENGIWNPELGETWVDCGGDCGPCPTSANGCQDGDEDGVDCGGSTGIDCLSLCDDGLPNGFEDNAAIDCLTPPGFPPDCGGPCEDCPTCDDIVMNQSEIGIDCGGSGCPDCATNGSCLNGFIDGDELYIDCYELEDAVGYCPQCDQFITCDIGGNFTEFIFNVSATIAGGTMTVNAENIIGEQITFVLAEPVSEWPVDYDDLGSMPIIVANQGGLSGSAAAFIDIVFGVGDPFSTGFDTNGCTFNFTYIDADVPGYVVGTFSGSMKTNSGAATRNFSNGKFRFIVN